MARGYAQRFGSRHHTYLSERFDRTAPNERVHFASAMTLLGYQDGTDHQDGASYLELAAFLMQQGAQVEADLTELWRRIVFNVCVTRPTHNTRCTRTWCPVGKERSLLTVNGRERVNRNAALNACKPTQVLLDETNFVNA